MLGHISGAHMNPAVTIGAVILGIKTIPTGIVYTVGQFIGATVGYGLLMVRIFIYNDLRFPVICYTDSIFDSIFLTCKLKTYRNVLYLSVPCKPCDVKGVVKVTQRNTSEKLESVLCGKNLFHARIPY